MPFFVPPNERTSTPCIRNHRFGRDAECGYGIREPRSVHMQEHIVFVCQIGRARISPAV